MVKGAWIETHFHEPDSTVALMKHEVFIRIRQRLLFVGPFCIEGLLFVFHRYFVHDLTGEIRP